MIIAGPGTGKTFTLVKRALYLIVEKGVKPENILIATFTEKAAKELITRISNELIKLNITVNINDLYIGTRQHQRPLHRDYTLHLFEAYSGEYRVHSAEEELSSFG